MRYGLETRTYLGGKPMTCHWCGGTLDRLRHIFKGKDSLRHYDSEKCLIRGEQRAAQRKDEELKHLAAHAGRVHSHFLVGAVVLTMLMLAYIFGGGSKAFAHDPLTHQVNELANARSKMGGLCCDGQDYAVPHTWERTNTGYRIHFKGDWVDIPKDAEVNNMRNPDGEAKAWIGLDETGTPYVRCFMPGMEG